VSFPPSSQRFEKKLAHKKIPEGGKSRPGGAKMSPGGHAPPTSRAYEIDCYKNSFKIVKTSR